MSNIRKRKCESCHTVDVGKVIMELGSDKMQWTCPYCGHENSVRY